MNAWGRGAGTGETYLVNAGAMGVGSATKATASVRAGRTRTGVHFWSVQLVGAGGAEALATDMRRPRQHPELHPRARRLRCRR